MVGGTRSSRLAAVIDGLPLEDGSFALLVVGDDGSGRSELLDAVALAVDRPVVHLVGRRLELGEPLAALSGLLPSSLEADAGTRQVREALVAALEPGSVLLVDDAHWIDGPSARALAGVVARSAELGLGVVVARRPGTTAVEHAALDEAATAARAPVVLGPLDFDEATERVALTLDAPADEGLVDALLERTAGHPSLFDLLLAAWRDEGLLDRGSLVGEPSDRPAPAVVESLRTRIGSLPEPHRAVLETLALGGELDDGLVAELSGIDVAELGPAVLGLRRAGLLRADIDELPPLVAAVVRALVAAPERRRFHLQLVDLLGDRPLAPTVRAEHLEAAGAVGPDAARAFLAAGDQQLAVAPEVARHWYDRAAAAGAAEDEVAGRSAHVELLSGDPTVAARRADAVLGRSSEATRWAVPVVAAAAASAGQHRRASDLLLDQEDPLVRLLAAPSLFAVADLDGLARLTDECAERLGTPRSGDADAALETAAGLSALGRDDPAAALDHLTHAAALVESLGSARVLTDSPHALGALVALLVLDFTAAADLLTRAIEGEVGGQGLHHRHRVLRAWCDLRSGQWSRAEAVAHEYADRPLAPRDAVFQAALEAGLARRSGDVAGLAEAWRRAEATLLRFDVDVLALEAVGEIAVAAARLDAWERAAARVSAVAGAVDALGAPATLTVPLAWLELQRVLAEDREDAIEDVGLGLARSPVRAPRHEVLVEAAAAWAALHRRSISADQISSAAEALQRAGLAWEASRLTGQAAIRAKDAGLTRSLLGQARDLREAVASGEGEPSRLSVLSDREQEVARLVVDGLTYKEIGGQLYISPKTVEHHVAKIRQKLGAGTRAEMLAALRAELT